jgi:hypothetical protein
VSFIVCVVLCALFCLSVVCYLFVPSYYLSVLLYHCHRVKTHLQFKEIIIIIIIIIIPSDKIITHHSESGM